MIEYGVTPEGFRGKRLINIKNDLEDLFIGEFGEINLEPQSVAGQLIGIFSKTIADIWENMEFVYTSQYPNSATGISLDNVVQLNGITRLPALRTSVIGAATGQEGTLIPAGSLARTPENGEVFFSTQNTIITRTNSIQNIVRATNLAAQEYRVLIGNTSYVYSLPIMTFSGPFVSGNQINVRLNGENLPTITYATSSAATFTALANLLATNPAVASATVVGTTIELVPVLGRQIVLNSVEVSGGGAPTYSLVFDTPASTDDVAEYLSALLDNAPNVFSTYISGDTFLIQARDSEFPYSLSLGLNLVVDSITSPVPFLSQNYGPIPAPVGSLTQILTSIAGWFSITNFKAGVTGRLQETDEELRLRRLASLRVLGAGTVEAIRSRLLQEVPGVTSVNIFENVTMTQDPILITFSGDFVSGNSIVVKVDTVNVGTVNYAVSHLATITAVANVLASQLQISSAVVQGVNNREILVTMISGLEIEIDFDLTGSGVPTFVTEGGRPPKSFEAVVQGGTDQAVALKIWQTKPAGIQTFGNTHVIITDSQGNPQGIDFTRAIPIYLWATVALVLNPQETFPPNGQELVAQTIVLYGNTLGIGTDVFIQRVLAQVFTIPGIASATVQLARTLNPNDTPSYVSTDIEIAAGEISVWDLARIIVSV